ncbi:MAG: Do family serine endopeptidase [Bryobacteraceae bacterium]
MLESAKPHPVPTHDTRSVSPGPPPVKRKGFLRKPRLRLTSLTRGQGRQSFPANLQPPDPSRVSRHMRRRIPSILTLLPLVLTIPSQASRLEPSSLPSEGFAAVVSRVLPSVVRVAVARTVTVPAAKSETEVKASHRRRENSEGSGIVIASDGYVLTNFHVVEAADKIAVQMADNREFEAHILAADAQTDVAVLKLDATGLPAASFGDSSRVRPGDYAIAIGNPFGVGTTVTFGIVSAVGRSGSGLRQHEEWIQTDAAINPGNSGGPLITTSGELIGINTAIVSPSGGSSGIGFAIPSNLVQAVMSELIVHGHVRRGYMGIAMQPMTPVLAEALGAPASSSAMISDVNPGSPAEQAGLAKGDVVAAIDGQPIHDFGRLRFYSALTKPGETIRIQIYRDGEPKSFAVTLAERPAAQAPAVEAAVPAERTAPGFPGAKTTDLDAKLRTEFELPETTNGVVLATVDPEGDTAAAGFRPGDIIVAVNKKLVSNTADLTATLASSRAKALLVEVSRGGVTWFFGLDAR